VKNGTLQVPEDFDGAQKLIEIVGEASLRVALSTVGENLDLRFLTLRFGG
jgi:hypothetical protein